MSNEIKSSLLSKIEEFVKIAKNRGSSDEDIVNHLEINELLPPDKNIKTNYLIERWTKACKSLNTDDSKNTLIKKSFAPLIKSWALTIVFCIVIQIKIKYFIPNYDEKFVVGTEPVYNWSDGALVGSKDILNIQGYIFWIVYYSIFLIIANVAGRLLSWHAYKKFFSDYQQLPGNKSEKMEASTFSLCSIFWLLLFYYSLWIWVPCYYFSNYISKYMGNLFWFGVFLFIISWYIFLPRMLYIKYENSKKNK